VRLLYIEQFLLDCLQLFVQLVLLVELGLVLSLQFLQFLVVLSLHGLQLLPLLSNHGLFELDLLLLLGDLFLQLLPLLLLLLLDVHHLRLQVLLVLLHLRDLVLLVLQLLLGIIELLLLVVEPVDLGLELVGLLLLDHLDVPLSDLLDLAQARVTESVPNQGDLRQSRVLVQGLQEDGLN